MCLYLYMLHIHADIVDLNLEIGCGK
jgi:hypothetical protein